MTATRRLAHRRPRPPGRGDRRHGPLLPARGPPPRGRSGPAGSSSTARTTSSAWSGSGTCRAAGFSLAAIRALLETERPEPRRRHLRRPGRGRAYSLDELVERGRDRAELCARAPGRPGCSATPPSTAATPTTTTTSTCCARMAELARGWASRRRRSSSWVGSTPTGIEADPGARCSRSSRPAGAVAWEPGELEAFQARRGVDRGPDCSRSARRLVDYVHHRTIQRLTLGAIEQGRAQPARSPSSAKRRGARSRAALPPVILAFSSLGIWPIVSSMTLREYGQSLPWCG